MTLFSSPINATFILKKFEMNALLTEYQNMVDPDSELNFDTSQKFNKDVSKKVFSVLNKYKNKSGLTIGDIQELSSKLSNQQTSLKYADFSSLRNSLPNEKQRNLPPMLFHELTGLTGGYVYKATLLDFISDEPYIRERLETLFTLNGYKMRYVSFKILDKFIMEVSKSLKFVQDKTKRFLFYSGYFSSFYSEMIKLSMNRFSFHSVPLNLLMKQADFLSFIAKKDTDLPETNQKVDRLIDLFLSLYKDQDGILTPKDFSRTNFLSPLFGSCVVEKSRTPCNFDWFCRFYECWSTLSGENAASIVFEAMDVEKTGNLTVEILQEFYDDTLLVALPIFEKFFSDNSSCPRKPFPSFDQMVIRLIDSIGIKAPPVNRGHMSSMIVLRFMAELIDARSLILSELNFDILELK